MFRNRATGQITIGQVPNIPLVVFLLAWFVRFALEPSGGIETALDVIAWGALAIWAGDEILRGVNPFRRLLGAVVMGGLIASLL
jgi:hypothetical protein